MLECAAALVSTARKSTCHNERAQVFCGIKAALPSSRRHCATNPNAAAPPRRAGAAVGNNVIQRPTTRVSAHATIEDRRKDEKEG